MPLLLNGHHGIITNLALSSSYQFYSRSDDNLLCSCDKDYVIIWNIEMALKQQEQGLEICGQVIGQALGHVTYCSFCPVKIFLALCINSDVLIMNIKYNSLKCILADDKTIVSMAEFCPSLSCLIITITSDHTFKIWDFEDKILLYSSAVISVHSITSIALHPLSNIMCVGTEDGMVRFYDLTKQNGFRQTQQIDTKKAIKHHQGSLVTSTRVSDQVCVVSSQPVCEKKHQLLSSPEVDSAGVEDTILALHYLCTSHYQLNDEEMKEYSTSPEKFRHFLENPSRLLVATPAGILQINIATLESLEFWNYKNHLISCNFSLPSVGYVGFQSSLIDNKVWCIMGSLLTQHVYILSLTIVTATKIINDLECLGINVIEEDKESFISVLSSEPLVVNSPLKAQLTPKDSTLEPKKICISSGTYKKNIIQDLPVTFKEKVKSSGYTSAPRMIMFQPKPSTKVLSQRKPRPTLPKGYSTSLGPPQDVLSRWQVTGHNISVNSLSFSGDGSSLACSLANKQVQIWNKQDLAALLSGHNGNINSAAWSADNKWLITASEDKSAKIWTSKGHLVMDINHITGNIKSNDSNLQVFTSPIKLAQFYYMDKFLLASSGNSFFLYKYHLDLSKTDLKRYINRSRYKLVSQLHVDSAQCITALSAINSFFSYIVLVAASDKSLHIFDMNVGQKVHTLSGIHNHAVHSIQQNQGSSYIAQPAYTYDLFLTSAVNDGIKLWDLRSTRCVQRYEGHMTRSLPCGFAISPCGQYICSGSEDRMIYVYDIKQSSYIYKLAGQSDAVISVTFNPALPQVRVCEKLYPEF